MFNLAHSKGLDGLSSCEIFESVLELLEEAGSVKWKKLRKKGA